MKRILSLALLLLAAPVLHAREINPDGVYFRKNSGTAQKLTRLKLGVFSSLGAWMADNDVAFHGWLSRNMLFYVKELESADTFIIYTANALTRARTEIYRSRGIPLLARSTPDGKHIVIKRVIKQEPFASELLVIGTDGRVRNAISGTSVLPDFTISPDNRLLIERERGITAHDPKSGREELIVPRAHYAAFRRPGGSVLAYLSPRTSRIALLSGAAGDYALGILNRGRTERVITTATSATEAGWLDENTLAFRTGAPGAFSVSLLNAATGAVTRLPGESLNTSLTISPVIRRIGYSIDGTGGIYDMTTGRYTLLPVEGDELLFASSDIFAMLYAKRLFVLNYPSLLSRSHAWKSVMDGVIAQYEEAAKVRPDWDSDWTGEYIRRKIATLRKIHREVP